MAMPHRERHVASSALVRDIVIGMSDGLTVPFALAAGISGAVANSRVVVMAGLAEIAAGSIAMGLGGYLAARTEHELYLAERQREEREVDEMPQQEIAEVAEIVGEWGIPAEHASQVVRGIAADRERWVDFMMRYELGLERPDPNRARNSSLTIGLSYVAGGLVPLFPYMVWQPLTAAFWISVAVTGVALFVFGAIKGRYTGAFWLRTAAQTTLVGGLAAAAAYLLARAFAG
jgi:VIT1/CCC1 family predicted Fe2+/Mn2+ transporter